MKEINITLLPPSKPAPPELSVSILSNERNHSVEISFFTPGPGKDGQQLHLAFSLPCDMASMLGIAFVTHAKAAR